MLVANNRCAEWDGFSHLERLVSRRGALRSMEAMSAFLNTVHQLAWTFLFLDFRNGFSSKRFASDVSLADTSRCLRPRITEVLRQGSSSLQVSSSPLQISSTASIRDFNTSGWFLCFGRVNMKYRAVLRPLAASCRPRTRVLVQRSGIRWASDTWSAGPAQKAGSDS